jgi:hypothetical protein
MVAPLEFPPLGATDTVATGATEGTCTSDGVTAGREVGLWTGAPVGGLVMGEPVGGRVVTGGVVGAITGVGASIGADDTGDATGGVMVGLVGAAGC